MPNPLDVWVAKAGLAKDIPYDAGYKLILDGLRNVRNLPYPPNTEGTAEEMYIYLRTEIRRRLDV